MKDKIKTMASAFKALGDENRLKIIKMLASNRDDVLCVTDIAGQLGITQPAASQHIRVLKNIGILVENRRGFRVYYYINTDAMKRYKAGVDELFKKTFERCPHNYTCDECPFNDSCG